MCVCVGVIVQPWTWQTVVSVVPASTNPSDFDLTYLLISSSSADGSSLEIGCPIPASSLPTEEPWNLERNGTMGRATHGQVMEIARCALPPKRRPRPSPMSPGARARSDTVDRYHYLRVCTRRESQPFIPGAAILP